MLKVAIFALALVGAAGVAVAQSIDSVDEAWAIASRNSVSPDEWTMAYVDNAQAAFIKNEPVSDSAYWVMMLDTEDLTSTLAVAQIECGRSSWSFGTSTIRSWSGEFISSSPGSAPDYVVPGSVGQAIYDRLCIGVPDSAGRTIWLPVQPNRSN